MTGIVLVKLAAALICFHGHCYPALVGADTPIGTYQIQFTEVTASGYAGNVLAFKQNKDYMWAVHRVWRGSPWQHRLWRIQYGTARERHITNGCVNVMPYVYDKLVDCCSSYKIVIEQ